MNKIGIYYAYWVRYWDVDFHPFIDKAAKLGFDVLELNAGTVAEMSPEERKRLKAHADERGLILTYCIGLPPKYDLASPDRSIRENGIAYLRKLAEAIGEMGGGPLGGIIYGSWPTNMPPDEMEILFSCYSEIQPLSIEVNKAMGAFPPEFNDDFPV